MRSIADQYPDRPADVLFCFDISRYAAYFDFYKTKYNYTRPKFPYFTVVSLHSCLRINNNNNNNIHLNIALNYMYIQSAVQSL